MWVRFRHKIVFAVFKPFFFIYTRLKYGYHAKKYHLDKGPCLMLYNHPTNLDPIMMALSFSGPIYFVTNDDVFNNPLVSVLLRYLVAPIPKAKGVRDISTVKNCIRIIKEGGRIGIAPEGNRNYSGRLNHIDKSIVKLVRFLKVPVVLYNINGGFGVNPRFSISLRKGKMFGEVNRVISPEEIKSKSDEELLKIIIEGLDVDDVLLQQKYKSKAKAENLESAFYICPVCNSLSSLYSQGDFLHCKECGLEVEYTEELLFKTSNPLFKFKTVYEYYQYQEEFIRNCDYGKISFSDENIHFRVITKKRRKDLIYGKVEMNSSSLLISDDHQKIEIKLTDIFSCAVIYHNTLVINLEKETYQLVGDRMFNALKYLHYFYKTKLEKGDKNEFLGI